MLDGQVAQWNGKRVLCKQAARATRFYNGASCFPTAFGEDTDDASDPNRIVQCPYDKNHQIRASRFPFHVLKCRKVGYGREGLLHMFIFHIIVIEIVKTLCSWHLCNESVICLPRLFQNHPKLASELKTCPFNARHLIPKHELSHHITNCEDKRSLNAEDG